ncbi:EF-hand domain-containing protein [Roseitranquillus sediminis]|uniref:hypothetical protein n=1 Tax=Roseitranquillus sediminis TaxID=2809051 RepID=UPI001D0C15F8|nr:hypothetical protein [Roseitranquillus sediminis]MBM9595496.1 hypothetical protein [Roseitranquillus sediminis]
MINDLFKLAAGSALALSLASGPLVAQEAFGEWDADANAGIDAAEFNTGLGNELFAAADTDSDESLSEDELSAALGDQDVPYDYSAWDGDGDGIIRESEFLSGLYSAYDVDADGSLDEEEFGNFEAAGFLNM